LEKGLPKLSSESDFPFN